MESGDQASFVVEGSEVEEGNFNENRGLGQQEEKGKEMEDREGEEILKEAIQEISEVDKELRGWKLGKAKALMSRLPTKEIKEIDKKISEKNKRLKELQEVLRLIGEFREAEVSVVRESDDEFGGLGGLDPLSPISEEHRAPISHKLSGEDSLGLGNLSVESHQESLEKVAQVLTSSLVASMAAAAQGFSFSSPSSSSSSSAGPSIFHSSNNVVVHRRQKVKNVPVLEESRTDEAMVVVRFIYSFELCMKTHGVCVRDQKEYLLEALHSDVQQRLLLRGIQESSVKELLDEVKIATLGRNWLRMLFDEWEALEMEEGESVFEFRQKIFMMSRALGRDPEHDGAHRGLMLAEIRPKLPQLLRELLEEEGVMNFLEDWEGFWVKLEKIEGSFRYEDRLLLYERAEEGDPLEEVEPERDKGKGKALGGFCARCGSRYHESEDCNHPKGSKILMVNGRWPKTCFKCFKTGHMSFDCGLRDNPKEEE